MNRIIKAFNQTLMENRVTFFWLVPLFCYLVLYKDPPHITGSLLTGIWHYWLNHAGILMAALKNTLLAALPAAVLLLLLSFLMALLATYKKNLGTTLIILVSLSSLLPSVYLIHLVRILSPGAAFHSETLTIFVLIFSNLVLYFFFLGFKKDIREEFDKEYHFLARQLGITSKLASARQKLVLIALERFLPLFIMVFSSTIFVESKLNVNGGIYTFLYDTLKSVNINGRPDIFWGQLLFILIFVYLLQLTYGTLLGYIKNRFF